MKKPKPKPKKQDKCYVDGVRMCDIAYQNYLETNSPEDGRQYAILLRIEKYDTLPLEWQEALWCEMHDISEGKI